MSEPITRAEFRDFLIHKERVDLLHPSTSPALIFDSWCEQRRTESAPPPRALVGITGPVLPYESGPGQPTDLAAQLENDASAWEEAALAADEYDHAPEGMRETAALEREAAAEIRRLRAESESRYRAGIEEAARMLDPITSWSGSRGALATEVRALADKPAPDERKRCLEIVQRHIDAEVHATFADGATLQDAFAAGCEMTAKTIFDDIAGTQRFARPIENIDGDAKQERFDAPFAARKGG